MEKTMFEMAAEIIKSQCSTKMMTPDEIISSLHNTYNTLQSLQFAEKQGVQITDQTNRVNITPGRYIHRNKIICLECGQELAMISFKTS